jgi:hypothetical protein
MIHTDKFRVASTFWSAHTLELICDTCAAERWESRYITTWDTEYEAPTVAEISSAAQAHWAQIHAEQEN